MGLKLELGCGKKPTPGYLTNDLTQESDIPGNAWEIVFESKFDEIIALALMEHFTKEQFIKTLHNVYELLDLDGCFVFDVPNLEMWFQYYIDYCNGKDIPTDIDHIKRTIFGHYRWPGDEHKWGWNPKELKEELQKVGFKYIDISDTAECWIKRGIKRGRFNEPWNAHYYVECKK